MDATAVAGRGEGGNQEVGCARARSCHVSGVVASLDEECDAQQSSEHAVTQQAEADDDPQPPQGGAGLHGAIAAAAQRGGERGGAGEAERSIR